MDLTTLPPHFEDLQIPSHVQVIAASKTKSADHIRAVYRVGFRNFGENYLQEALPKIALLRDLPDIRWHFIGQLQSNKVKTIAEVFDMVQSVDSIKLAHKLDSACQTIQKRLPVLIQVNIGHEPQKGGVLPADLEEICRYCNGCRNLDLQGLMAIPPLDQNPIPYFTQMKTLYSTLQDHYNLRILSLGMSADYHDAILYGGANMIRIGTKIFGERR